ncbi:hypothetical protein Dsin_022250 [Dipteronia sinensis]|uniref:Uncharacterized protein n=1 Tax=Dipteronia sinensis TaxID=43782 RepID=A0AAE0DZK9_9ROSI|nr:hypothetical protein Dsin_022250 [Dipteronia sinensis]
MMVDPNSPSMLSLRPQIFLSIGLPFCKKFIVESRNHEAYFAQVINGNANHLSQQLLDIKKKYEDMKTRIESAITKGSISKEIRDKHDGFSEWNDEVTKQNHQSIVQIIIDGRGTNASEKEGICQLPTWVYMAREKRSGWSHNFKARVMNSLILIKKYEDLAVKCNPIAVKRLNPVNFLEDIRLLRIDKGTSQFGFEKFNFKNAGAIRLTDIDVSKKSYKHVAKLLGNLIVRNRLDGLLFKKPLSLTKHIKDEHIDHGSGLHRMKYVGPFRFLQKILTKKYEDLAAKCNPIAVKRLNPFNFLEDIRLLGIDEGVGQFGFEKFNFKNAEAVHLTNIDVSKKSSKHVAKLLGNLDFRIDSNTFVSVVPTKLTRVEHIIGR